MNIREVDLSPFIHDKELALVGREHGEKVLDLIIKKGVNFERLEKECDKIVVKIPKRIVSINKSFFLGLFELTVQRLGREKFIQKYSFEASEHIKLKIENHVQAAVLRSSPGDILDV